jgi:hypothetical protein
LVNHFRRALLSHRKLSILTKPVLRNTSFLETNELVYPDSILLKRDLLGLPRIKQHVFD